MDQLGAQDAQYLFMEDGDVVANITGAYICDQSTAPSGIVRFRNIVKHIEERFGDSPLYRRKLMRVPMDLDLPYWVDDPHFSIENHVFHARLPKPADWRQFCIQLARYHSRPLDMGRPLWEIYILEGLDNLEGIPKGSFAFISKVHHSAIDGTAGLQLLGALTDLGPEGPPAFRYKPSKPPKDAPAVTAVLSRATINNARSPIRFANALRRSSPQIAQLAMKASRSRLRKDPSGGAPRTIFNDHVSPQKSFDAVEFSLADFKAIRSVFKEAKINDLILAVCSGALRKYLIAKNALPLDSLVAMAPINARPAAGDKSSKAAEGNNITAMTVPLFTNIEHPVERLKAIVLATHRTKAAKDGVGARLLTDLTKQAPAAMMSLASRYVIQTLGERQPLNNVIISNVPGPQVPLYFCGAKMLSMHGMAPLGPGMGLFIATPSYNNKISFGVTSTREIIPDPPFFMNCFRESFNELYNAAKRRVASNENRPEKTHSEKKKKKSSKKKNKDAG